MATFNAALIASRILAVYIGFHAVIYLGDFAANIVRARTPAVIAGSAIPSLILVVGTLAFWKGAARFAAACTAGARPDRSDPGSDPGADPAESRPLLARDAAQIAFAIAGLVIAAQAAPLAAHVAARAVAGDLDRDTVADGVAALARVGVGLAIMVLSRVAARRLIRA